LISLMMIRESSICTLMTILRLDSPGRRLAIGDIHRRSPRRSPARELRAFYSKPIGGARVGPPIPWSLSARLPGRKLRQCRRPLDEPLLHLCQLLALLLDDVGRSPSGKLLVAELRLLGRDQTGELFVLF